MIILFYFPELLNSSCVSYLRSLAVSLGFLYLPAAGGNFLPRERKEDRFPASLRRVSPLSTRPGHAAFFFAPVLSSLLADLTFPSVSGLSVRWAFFRFLRYLVSVVGAPPPTFLTESGQTSRPSIPQVPRRGRRFPSSPSRMHTRAGQLQESVDFRSPALSTRLYRLSAPVLHNHVPPLFSQRWKDHSAISLPCATFLCPLPSLAQYFTWYFIMYFISLPWLTSWVVAY